MAKQAATGVLEIPVSFGTVAFQGATARVAVSALRKDLTLAKADSQLCGKRLIGRIVAQPGVDNPDQGQLFQPGENDEVPGAFDIKSFTVNKKKLSFGLTFSLEDVEREVLSEFANQVGKLVVDGISDIPKRQRQPRKKGAAAPADE